MVQNQVGSGAKAHSSRSNHVSKDVSWNDYLTEEAGRDLHEVSNTSIFEGKSENSSELPDLEESFKDCANDEDIPIDGAFFARMGFPYALFAIVYVLFRTCTLLAGYKWSRNTTAELLGLVAPREYTKSERIALDVHAFLGMGLIGIIAYQYMSASFFASESVRRVHRICGRALVALWPVCIIVGAVHVAILSSDDREERMKSVGNDLVIGFTGVISLGNIIVGYLAIAHKPQEQRDYFLHKAAMFFSMHYAIGFTVSTLAIIFLQLAFSNCYIGARGETLGLCIGFLLQSLVLVSCMWRYDRRYFEKTIVRVNLGLLAAHNIIFVVGVFWAFLGTRFESEEGSCFAGGEQSLSPLTFEDSSFLN